MVMTRGFQTGIDSVRVMCGKMSNGEATLLVRTLVTSSLSHIFDQYTMQVNKNNNNNNN